MSDHKNLAEALAAFQAEMPTVAKKKTAKVKGKSKAGNDFEYTYNYADLADVSAAAMPLLSAHGLAFSATPRQGERGLELAGVLMHACGEEKEGALPLSGSTAQELGSSITYMRRYLLGCLTGIVTDDDDDGQAASQSRQRPQPQAAASSDGNGQRLASAKQRSLIFAKADENKLSNTQLAAIVLAATGNDPRDFTDEDAAGDWLRRSMERLPATKVNPIVEALSA